MNHSVRLRRLAAGSAAAALAFSALALVPRVVAQAPAPAAPATAGDAKDFDTANQYFQAGKWVEAMQGFEEFKKKYKLLSPRSGDAYFLLAISYLQQEKPLPLDAVKVLRELLADKKGEPYREQGQLLIAKAFTMQGATMPATEENQKIAQAKVLNEAIKEYDTFLTAFPKSASADTAYFLSGVLCLNVERWDDAIKRFSAVFQNFQRSSLRMPALLNIGKTFMAQGYDMMGPDKGKDPDPAQVKRALEILEKNALPALTSAYQQSGDLAIMNEAIYYIGQIQLTRSQNVTGDDDGAKKRQNDLLQLALDAFRAVRSREEVIAAQEAKIAGYRRDIQLLQPGTPTYLSSKSSIESLIDIETEKKAKFLAEQDQFLGARLAIARIFLFLKKPDECRVLLRYLQGQKEVLEKEKDAQASIGSLLCLTYIEQKNLQSAADSFAAFRAAFAKHSEGENLALLIANLYLENEQPDKAEEAVKLGRQDYSPWRFEPEAVQILIAAALKHGDYDKALKQADDALNNSPKPEVEPQLLFLKATVQRAKASQGGNGALADEAADTYQKLRDKYPNDPRSEDAWAEQCSIWSSRDPNKALPELQKFLDTFADGGGKSATTKANVPIVQFRLGQVLDAVGKKDEAIKAFQVLMEKWPESEPAPGAYFKVFDIYKERKDYANCRKLMEDFVQKYPDHENVYYAFNNIAEFLFTGVLNPKMGADGKPLAVGLPSLEDTEAGAKKLYEYVDYELSKDLKTKRGDGSLLKVADKWMERLAKLPPYTTQNNDQKLIWERSVEGIVVAIEKMLKSYPSGDKVSDGLDRLVTAQKEMLKARVIDAEKGEGYFRKLANEASSADLKARLLFALGAFVQDIDAKKASAARADGYASAGKAAAPAGSERPAPIFGAADWDRYLNDLFDARKFEDIAKGVARIRSEYKEETGEGAETPMPVQNALAVALFWEAKVLGEQGKAVEAGNLYSQLAKKYPKSTKVFEADYGIIYGQVEAGTSSDPTFLPRLTKIVNNVRDVKTFELPAKALYLIGRIQERERDYEAAVATYLKIHTRYESVPDVAGDGLWAGAQLLEKQAAGTIPVRTQKELAAAAAAKAAKAKAQKEKEDAEKKKAEGQSKTDSKATDAKPADPKAPGVAKTAPATAQK